MHQKLIFLLTILLFSLSGKAQYELPKDTLIHLEEVIIKNNKKVKKYISKVELKGIPAFNGLNYVKKEVSAIRNIPKGRLSYVDFYFNTGLVNLFKKKLNINYKDTQLGLLIYEIGEDGKPGKAISENQIKFIVTKEHDGKFRIDLTPLNLQCTDIFIGFEVLSTSDGKEDNIYVRYNDNDEACSYYISKNSNNQNWLKTPFRKHFKLTLGVEKIKLR
ncbi:hypothetical protein ACFS5J_04955 [Flavobacterium chuncheonense]|uniref:Uncharacterized protein n=1 Tax=Flavobacterium chuncheonense TaxID=2026653 RepID=A0ABW5YJV8_9FLAO